MQIFGIQLGSSENVYLCFILFSQFNLLCPTYIHKIHNSAQATLGNVSIRATCYTTPSHSGHPQYPGLYMLRSSNPNLNTQDQISTPGQHTAMTYTTQDTLKIKARSHLVAVLSPHYTARASNPQDNLKTQKYIHQLQQ